MSTQQGRKDDGDAFCRQAKQVGTQAEQADGHPGMRSGLVNPIDIIGQQQHHEDGAIDIIGAGRKTTIGGEILKMYNLSPTLEGQKEIINSVIPVFVKAGSIIIKNSPSDKNLTVHIYPGQNAEFTLYEDDGETNNYKNGEYCKTLFSWNDSTKSLTINKIDGNWSGKQKFSIWLHSPNIPAKIVNFKGKLLTVKFK